MNKKSKAKVVNAKKIDMTKENCDSDSDEGNPVCFYGETDFLRSKLCANQ